MSEICKIGLPSAYLRDRLVLCREADLVVVSRNGLVKGERDGLVQRTLLNMRYVHVESAGTLSVRSTCNKEYEMNDY
jgi:hypothetical protein